MGSVMDSSRDKPDMVPAYELVRLRSDLATARARIAELTDEDLIGRLLARRDEAIQEAEQAKARLASLTTVTDEDVERVAEAISQVLSIWHRYDDWSDQSVEGKPHQLCCHDPDEEIIVLACYATKREAETAQPIMVNEARARAALTAFVSR